ncbi:arsenate reductase/protein-tyrosine-phosphatase family protein [Williamwhitmania taraxaci]|uniref:Arsenate reductase n=1 Tax=Williamwhitmania taraxaci TaxID=1640674 RepID=A0A1G6N3B7_9BACT|nr:hypothetical protein [Williamwhitmania taraxaci]SDC61934.1 arsenate reductase [Williamwhitmania taraxaci]
MDEKELKRVLVVSTDNACRSQMAEGWLNYYGKNAIVVKSAGITKSKLDLEAAHAMMEAVIDISAYTSKSIEEVKDFVPDYVFILSEEAEQLKDSFTNTPIFFTNHLPTPPEQTELRTVFYQSLCNEMDNYCFDMVHKHFKELM